MDGVEIGIACEATDNVGLAYHQNHVPVAREIAIENRGGQALADLLLTVTSNPPAIRQFEQRIDALAAGAKVRLEAPAVALDPTLLRSLSEAVELELAIQVENSSGVLGRLVIPLRLLPPSHWGGCRSAPELVAAFVRPNDPAVDVVLREAAGKLATAVSQAALMVTARADVVAPGMWPRRYGPPWRTGGLLTRCLPPVSRPPARRCARPATSSTAASQPAST